MSSSRNVATNRNSKIPCEIAIIFFEDSKDDGRNTLLRRRQTQRACPFWNLKGESFAIVGEVQF
jgi:hypothetical protein